MAEVLFGPNVASDAIITRPGLIPVNPDPAAIQNEKGPGCRGRDQVKITQREPARRSAGAIGDDTQHGLPKALSATKTEVAPSQGRGAVHKIETATRPVIFA
jgi:hypothetical protein